MMLATRPAPKDIPFRARNELEAAVAGPGFIAMWQPQHLRWQRHDWQHRRWRLDAEAFADGELASARRGSVQRHLNMCWACSEDLEVLRMMKASLRRQSQRLPPIELARFRRIAERVTGSRPPSL